MPLWTKRHIIPVIFGNYPGSLAESIVFDDKIWIVCEIKLNVDSYQTRIFVFDPVPDTFTAINCVYPARWPSQFRTLAADESDLYMWRLPHKYPESAQYLFKLDRASLKWEKIIAFHRFGCWISVVIINQVMYVLERDNQSGLVFLLRIDLVNKKLMEIKPLIRLSSGWNGYLSSHNNNLYLMEVGNGNRKVSMIKTDELQVVAQEKVQYTNEHNFENYLNSNVCISYQCASRKFEACIFDFESLKWTSEVTKPDWQDEYTLRIQSTVKVNGSLYTLVRVYNEESIQFELHELDLHPKLTSICLVDLTNRVSKKKLDNVERRLPNQLRDTFKELLQWKREAEIGL